MLLFVILLSVQVCVLDCLGVLSQLHTGIAGSACPVEHIAGQGALLKGSTVRVLLTIELAATQCLS